MRSARLPRILTPVNKITSLLALTLLAGAAFALAACSGGDSTTTSRTVASDATPSIGALYQAVDTALVPDRIEMARLTGYEKVACAKKADAQHPACRSDEKAGTKVEVLPKLGCDEPGFVRPEDVPPLYSDALEGRSPTLTAVYTPAPKVDNLGAQFIAVIAAGKHDSGADNAVALHIRNGRIVAFEDDCGDALKLIDEKRVASWVMRPGARRPETPTAAADTPSADATSTDATPASTP
jgi:hypothetical protein